MHTAPSFGGWLRQQRRARAWTQEELAAQVNCSPAMIRKIEAGERRPSRQMAELLAERLALPPTERPAFFRLAREEAPPAPAAPPIPVPRPERATPALPPSTNGTLPHYLTPLIGREAEVAAVGARLLEPSVRLLTLTGSPGIGKTRLALAVAGQVAAHFADGVFFAGFAPLNDPALVPAAIAQALGLQEAGSRPAQARLVPYLRDRQLLLLLDNFEHVIAAAPIVSELLATCPQVRLLVTSRQALRVRGERQWAVPPLAVPLEGVPADPAALATIAAVALFVERARAVNPAFALTADNAAAVTAICARLEGLPLAIEIASARIKLLAPREIAARLDHRLKMLTGGPRDLPLRHQTLRDAIGWSYDLLPPEEQRLFARLGVFVGGCTLAAAERVASGDTQRVPGVASGDGTGDQESEAGNEPLPANAQYATRNTQHAIDPPSSVLRPPSSVLEGLASLLDKSLLQQLPEQGGEARVTMLETVREFALERLEAAGEAEMLRRRHAAYYLGLAEQALVQLRDMQAERWLAILDAGHNNLRTALQWSLGTPGQEAVGARLTAALWLFWYRRGYVAEGRGWVQRALALPPTPALAQARADLLFGLGQLAWGQGDLSTARQALEESVALAEALDAPDTIGPAQSALSGVLLEQGELERARIVAEQSLITVQTHADPRVVAWSQYFLGMIALREGDHATAGTRFADTLAWMRQMPNKRDVAILLSFLADGASLQGDYAAAVAYAEESLNIARDLGDQRETDRARHALAFSTYRHGDYARAAALFAENTAVARRKNNRLQLAWELNHRGNVLRCLEAYAEAAAHYAEAQTLFAESTDKHGLAAVFHNQGYMAQHQGEWHRSAVHFREALELFDALGYRWSVIDCIAGLAAVRRYEGYPVQAARLLGAADALHRAIDPSMALLEPANRLAWERTIAQTRTDLDPAPFQAAWDAGRALSLDQARAEALVIGAPAG